MYGISVKFAFFDIIPSFRDRLGYFSQLTKSSLLFSIIHFGYGKPTNKKTVVAKRKFGPCGKNQRHPFFEF